MQPTTTHGGKRIGAGRKPTGRKKQVLFLTDDEYAKIKELINNLREEKQMKINTYQIDRRQENGELDRYDIVKATSRKNALREYLGDDYNDYELSIKGKTLTARCPAETSSYLEVIKI